MDTLEKLYQEVVEKAWNDESFKQELMKDPLAALSQVAGGEVKLPEGKTLKVADQSDTSTVYINIPKSQKTDDVELTEEQLDVVSGGFVSSPLPIIDIFPFPIDIILPPPPNPEPIYTIDRTVSK